MKRLSVAALLAFAPALSAQNPCGAPFITRKPDTVQTTAQVLSPMVVTADRSRGSLFSTSSAVTRLSGADLVRYPRATFVDLLRLAPGLPTVSFDGMGFDPQLMTRGFYGGGEAEYVVVLVDGLPVNRLESGLVAWDALPAPSAIEAIEIVRGGASSLYGDAAIGGVINVITRAEFDGRRADWEVAGGSAGTVRGEASIATRGGTAAAGVTRSSGYRDHAERTMVEARGGLLVHRAGDFSIRASAASHWRAYDEPGPQLQSRMSDPKESDPLFRFDHATDRGATATLRAGSTTPGGGSDAFLTGEFRDGDAIRTLALAPGYGDTRERSARTYQARSGAQLERSNTVLPGADQVIVGVEAGWGWLDSRYFLFQSGTRDQYAAASGERGDLDTEWSAGRSTAALFGQYAVDFGLFRFSLGARWDGLHDRFHPKGTTGDTSSSADHSALSPKAGLNIRYGESGNLYLAASRSFKAPTLDQLYDQRNIPVPFPPYQIRTSNPLLEPQHGTNLEVGAYQRFGSDRFQGTFSLSGYQTSMTDEIDFDIESFRYVNIGRSRHRGVEAGLQVGAGDAAIFLNYTLQQAIGRSGENAGRRLKAIPRHTIVGGGSLGLFGHLLTLSAVATHLRDIYLDDANQIALPDYVTVDFQAAARTLGAELFLDLRNALGERYDATGYPDPSGSGDLYLYPAAGRTLQVGIRSGGR